MSTEVKKPTFKVLSEGVWLLENVRLSFPNIWKVGKYDGEDKPNFDASFLIPVEYKDVAKRLHVEMVKLAKTINGKINKVSEIKHPKIVKSKDGANWVVKTSNSLDKPAIYFQSSGEEFRGDPLSVGADKELYAGCYVRAKLTLNPAIVAGKCKVWSNLAAIQWLAHGERLGTGLSGDDLAEGFGEVESSMAQSGEPTPPADNDDFSDDDDFSLEDDESGGDDDDFDDDF